MLIEVDIQCPYCGEVFPLMLDSSQGEHCLVEDCTVCCRPIELRVTGEPGEILDVQIERG